MIHRFLHREKRIDRNRFRPRMDWGGGAIAYSRIYSVGLLKAKNLISIITGNRTL